MKSLFKFLFWTSNITFLLILCFGFFPSIGAAIVRDSIGGSVPIDLMLPFIGLLGVPLATTIAGSKQRQIGVSEPLQARSPLPLSLFELFYAIEAPILTACVIRLFMLRELTTASSFLLVSGILGFAGSCYWYWQQRQAEAVVQRGNLFSLVGLSLFLLVSLYLAAIASLFVLVIIFWFLTHLDMLALTIILFPLFACGFIVSSAPFGMVFVAQKLWWQNFQQSIEGYGRLKIESLVGVLAVVWVGVFSSLSYQPQLEAFELLKQQPVNQSVNLQKTEQIRQGLLNAYLADYRYLRFSGDQEKLSRGEQAIGSVYDFLIKPFTYQGKRADRETAAGLYAEFFDMPILRGEKDTIRRAVESNFNRAEVNAGLLSIDAKRVLLTNQQVKVTPHGDWADVELHETYRNQTTELQEIFYYFSLPESATMTGIWLGEADNKALSYPFQVSTRGAAQKIYKEQLVQRVDPALLEQVGPQNYRLRVYPILAQGQPMNMWMTYKVMKQANSWILPQLREQRNVYWNRNTNRSILLGRGSANDGKSIALNDKWLPDSIAADKSAPAVHQMTLPNGSNIIAKPFDANGYSLPQNKRLAIVVDSSYSMNAHRPELVKTIDWLRSKILPQNQIDLYLTTDGSVQPQLASIANFKPDRAIFYGSIDPKQMLEQFESLSKTAANSKYDAVIAITDRGSYELSTDKDKPKSMSAPLWMVHLGGLPFAYDDATLSMIQHSGGSVSTEIKTVMQRIATQPSLGKDTSLLSVVDNYAWYLSQAIDPTAKPKDEGFDAIAARQWITQVSQSLQPNQLKELDAVHVLAKQYNLVTPYSSMIVLVNDQQKQDLKNAEKDKDRFKRSVEDKQTLPAKVSATPEPAEWLLLAIITGMLVVVYRRNTIKSVV